MALEVGPRARNQAGFTLVEILVVMLILGLLAAVAIPAYFTQRDKALDADAKVEVRTVETALESYATDRNGNYAGATVDGLQAIEPSLNDVADANITLLTNGQAGLRYRIAITSATGNQFWIRRRTDGSLNFLCDTAGTGGCPASAIWGDV